MAKQVLDVFLHDVYVGSLTYEEGVLSFSYDHEYLQNPTPMKLSTSMPLQSEPFDHTVSEAFFSGLLPEEMVRKRLTRYLGISERNTFGLLQEIGGECAGAVSVYPKGIRPDTNTQNDFRVLEEDEAYDIMHQLDKRPMMVGEDDIRLSGAGAQDKLIVSIIDNKLAIPLRNTPSTHIIKPRIQDLENTVHNEFFCMSLAQRVGLPVPVVEIFYLKNEAYYLVERYDRLKKENGRIERLHQEDFCQALHIAPVLKYENEGGPSLPDCFELLNVQIKTGSMAGVNRMRMLQGVIFNFLIGNGDAHGKNFSLLYKGEVESLAPFYDLLCTLIYNDAYKSKMAMKVGSKYKFSDVTTRHFEQLGQSAGFKASFVKTQINKLTQKIEPQAVQLKDELNSRAETQSQVYDEIIEIIQLHCHRLV